MITFLYSAIAVFALLGAFEFLESRKRNEHNLLAAIAENASAWSAMILIGIMLLLPSHYLSWPFALAAPFACFGVVATCETFIMTVGGPVRRRINARFVGYVFLFFFAAELAYGGWLILPVDSPDASETVRRAEHHARRIETAQRTVQATLVSMHADIDSVSIPVADQSYSLKDFEQTALQLIELADTAARQHRDLKVDFDQLQTELNDAPAVFKDAAAVWHEYATEENKIGYPDLAERYEEIAALWDAHAKAIESNQETFLAMQQLEEAMRFVKRARQLLSRLAAHISDIPYGDVLGKQAELEANLALFIRRFDELRNAIKGLTEQLGEHSMPANRPAKAVEDKRSDQSAPGDRTAATDGSNLQWLFERSRLLIVVA